MTNWGIGCDLLVLRAETGSGKTEVLCALAELGVPTLDLEALANHAGSVYGGIGRGSQPDAQTFERSLSEAWAKFAPAQVVITEVKGVALGQLSLPSSFVARVSQADGIRLHVPRAYRIERLVQSYGQQGPEALAAATCRLTYLPRRQKREALDALGRARIHEFIEVLVDYYDEAYAQHLGAVGRTRVRIRCGVRSPVDIAGEILSELGLHPGELSWPS